MVIRDYYTTRYDGVRLFRSYSDHHFMIKNENDELYEEAIDVESATHTYTETAIPIEVDVESGEVSPEEALNILLGGE